MVANAHWWWVLLTALFALALPARAEAQLRISMNASSTRVGVGEPFALEIRVESDGEEPDKLELPDLSAFQVLGRSTSRPFSFSFGFGGGQRARVQSQTVYGFTLRAQEAGAHVIRPAIAVVGGRRVATQSLSIMVLDSGLPGADALNDAQRNPADVGALMRPSPDAPPTAANGGALDGAKVDNTMFVRTVVDKKRAYLGEQVTVSVYLYLRGQLSDSPQIVREATLDGFWSHDLLPMQRALSGIRQDVNGRPYNVYVLRKYAAFPLRPGTLQVSAPVIEVGGGGGLFDLFSGPTKSIKREGVPVSIEVLPLPAQPTPGAPTHTGTLSLEAALEPSQAKVGDAVTLRVTAKGSGNLRALTLANPNLRGIETLPPEIDDQPVVAMDRVGGTRTFRWLLLPRAAGNVTVPSFVVDAFDPASGTYQVVKSAPLTLTVSGATEAAPADARAAGDDPSLPQFGPIRPESALRRRSVPLAARPFFWPTVLAAPGLLLLATLGRVLRDRVRARRASGRDTLGQHEVEQKLEQAAQAVRQNDARSALGLLASALKRALELKLGEPVGGMTSRALEALLTARGFDAELRGRVMAQLSALESARFDPAGQSAVQLGQAQTAVHDTTKQIARVKIARAA